MLRRLILDVLFPIRGVSIIDLADSLLVLSGVESVNITVKEVDVDTQNILVVIEGEKIVFDDIKEVIEKKGGVIHSIDQVVVGKKIIEPPHYLLE
ncbi:MAG: DUF211 domain-containing protein [Desulfurococcaceae archaeon]